MSEPMPETAPSSIYAQPWAVRFGFAILVAFTLIVGLAFVDGAKRNELEANAETTSVGDSTFFALPDPAKAPAPAAVLDGRPLQLVEGKPFDVRDTHTHRVGQDAQSGRTIYTVIETATPAEKARVEHGHLLLKTAPGQYVAVQRGEAAK